MRRRGLFGVAAGLLGSLAGCVAGYDGTRGEEEAEPPDPSPGTVRNVELPVPSSEMRQPLAKDSIPAIVDPVFADDWRGLDPDGDLEPSLPDDAAVIGVERDGGSRAYPLRVLDWHEIVNDTFAGPLAVTYCPLCGSGVVVERAVAGDPTVFGVSGRLWRDDLVMYDRATGSLWSQILATAIRGPRTGDRLAVVPSTLTTWGEWRAERPGTAVLLPPPRSDTVRGRDRTYDYFDPKYGYGDETQLIGWDGTEDRLAGRTMVVGVSADGAVTAYPFPVVEGDGVVEDRVGGRPVVVATAPDGTLVAYDRRAEGRTLSFAAADGESLRAGGSRWKRTTGEAVDGPFEGTRLERANERPPMFLKGWLAFYPETEVYGADLDAS